MFAYFEVKENLKDKFQDALRLSGVALVTGAGCGDGGQGVYRMNMAHDSKYTVEAMEAIRRNM
jgi:bifunctional pyridoxal-dependent enzyme with beta-cystathionase and maltose regulon repressor activities